MAGPGDERAAGAGGYGHLRASHADRDQVIGALKAAYVAGMLAKDEFDLRVGQALASRTYADLANLTADLPDRIAAEQPPKSARTRGGQPLLRPSQIITGATVLYVSAWLYAPTVAGPALVVLGGFFYLCVLAIAIAVAFENRRDKGSGSQLPHGHSSGEGGSALRRLPPAGLGRQLPPADRGHRDTAEAAWKQRARPPLPARGHCAGEVPAAGTLPASAGGHGMA